MAYFEISYFSDFWSKLPSKSSKFRSIVARWAQFFFKLMKIYLSLRQAALKIQPAKNEPI